MRKTVLVLFAAALCAAQAPETAVRPVPETLHGVTITDPYRWLEDQNSPETRAWIGAQIRYTQSFLDKIPRAQLKRRLEELQRVDHVGMPIVRSGRYVFTRRLARENRPSLCLRNGPEGKDEVIVDPGKVSPDPSISVQPVALTEDGAILAYGVRKGGEDEREIRFLDLRKRTGLPDVLPRGRYNSVRFAPDNEGFYYAFHGPSAGPQVRYHRLGTPLSADRTVFGDGYSPRNFISLNLSQDGRHLLLEVAFGASGSRIDLFLKDLKSQVPPQTVCEGIEAAFYPRIGGDTLFLQTNWKAPNGRILAAPLASPSQENWREIVPEGASAIEFFRTAGKRLFVSYLENVVTRIRQFDAQGRYLGDVPLPGKGTVPGFSGRWTDDEAFYSYVSFLDPGTAFRYLISSGKRQIWHRPKTPVTSEGMEVRQVWFESKDKTRVPMFLVHPKGIRLDGGHPVLMTGYGGFTVARTPSFLPWIAVWTEMGGVFALPNLRGGGEFGEKWHRAGMLENKQNTFDDFIAAAEWLIANKYTRPERLAIRGTSNGGLLVAAAMTQRPDLFGAVYCGFPLLDMIRFHKFLLGPLWVTEYGSADDPRQFAYLHKYSPYHRVGKGVKYPAVMFESGDSDTRVAPLHARKMTALLQASTGSGKPVLLYYDTKLGHSAGKPVDAEIENTAASLAFLMSQAGMPVR